MPHRPLMPCTDGEWQDAVDAAHALLRLVSADRDYGLITGAPEVDERRCLLILRIGAARGIHPSSDALERMIVEINGRVP
jgi:hypothetical protein